MGNVTGLAEDKDGNVVEATVDGKTYYWPLGLSREEVLSAEWAVDVVYFAPADMFIVLHPHTVSASVDGGRTWCTSKAPRAELASDGLEYPWVAMASSDECGAVVLASATGDIALSHDGVLWSAALQTMVVGPQLRAYAGGFLLWNDLRTLRSINGKHWEECKW